MHRISSAPRLATGADRKYNLNGQVDGLIVRQDRNGQDWVSFDLVRPEGRTRCVAFTDKAADFLDNLSVSDRIHVWGYYEHRSFRTVDGKEIRTQRFKLLWSGTEPPASGPQAG